MATPPPLADDLFDDIQELIKKEGKFYFDEGSFQVKVVDDMMDALNSYIGREVTFGIRSEDIYDKLFVSEAPPENIVRVTVEVVEPMGSDVFIYLKTENHSFTARVAGNNKPEVNQEIDLVFDMSKTHFFNPETERAIT